MRLLLDTVTFIRAVKFPELLSKKAISAMEHPEAIRELSAISLSEIAIKHGIGKIDLSEADVHAAIAGFDLRVLSWKGSHAFRLYSLPNHHRDPFDRQLIAQALAENIPVVTSDEKFSLYRGIQVIW
jgi:PIN domain nuclease of toxin-antitoxin system